MAFIAFFVALVVSFLSVWLITIFFGNEYRYAGSILSVHVWAGLLVFVGVVRGKWMLVENLQKYDIALHVSGAVLNVMLNTVLIPKYHGLGAAYATIISYFFAATVTPMFIPRIRKSIVMILIAYINMLNFRTARLIYMEIGRVTKDLLR